MKTKFSGLKARLILRSSLLPLCGGRAELSREVELSKFSSIRGIMFISQVPSPHLTRSDFNLLLPVHCLFPYTLLLHHCQLLPVTGRSPLKTLGSFVNSSAGQKHLGAITEPLLPFSFCSTTGRLFWIKRLPCSLPLTGFLLILFL